MGKRSSLAIGILAVLTVTAVPAGARAQSAPAPAPQNNLTVYGGYSFGGGFTDVTTGKSWEMSEGPAFSVAADFGIDRNTQWELFVGYRNSALRASGFSPTANDIGVGITYIQLGGTYFVEQVGRGGYVVGGLGLTNFSPEPAGLGSETRFSLNLGFGYMIPLGSYLALKLEGRGYVTLIDSSSGFFCSGGCVVQIKGSTFTQGEVMAGIAARF